MYQNERIISHMLRVLGEIEKHTNTKNVRLSTYLYIFSAK